MTKNILKSAFIISAAFVFFSFDLPEGWFKAGDKPQSYDMGIDKGAGQDGKNTATIKSIEPKIKGFGTLMQNCLPDKYIGKRVRMSGFLKTKDVSGWSGFWLRVDQSNTTEILSFDNMHDGAKDRSVKGTTDWTKYEIVLDIPAAASNLAYGALLSGTGQVWFDNIKFEIVDNTVPVTGKEWDTKIPQNEPANLDFEK
ncbi:MAG: hypothetical protein JWP12_1289 [Bacteroidetes bacterium]|nr:hypothetical protein [Bacteroidota bacterium]